MSNLAGNQKRNPLTLGQVAQSVGDYFIRIKRYDEAREEYQEAIMAYNRVLQSSSQFALAQTQKGIIQKILDDFSPLAFVNDLSQWLQKNFTKATEAGWQMLEEILGARQLAFRTATSKVQTIKRAKRIAFNVEQTVVLVVELMPIENQDIKVIIRLYPFGEQTNLPDNLKFTVIPKSGEPHEYLAKSHHPAFKTEWFYKRGEQFRVKMQLNDVTVTEDFVI
jgi:tetratricopeptide (TPR) repeat protein